MTTYIPNLTLPEAVFNNPAISILFPITLGTVVGYSTRRTFIPPSFLSCNPTIQTNPKKNITNN